MTRSPIAPGHALPTEVTLSLLCGSPFLLSCLLSSLLLIAHPSHVAAQTAPGLSVEGFTLVDPVTNQDIKPLAEASAISLGELSGNRLNIRADVGDESLVESVHFHLVGPTPRQSTENVSVYALFGDRNGDYNNGQLAPGDYTVTATPYPRDDATGSAGTALTIAFRVVDPGDLVIEGFTLVDPTTDQDVGPLLEQGTIYLGDLGNGTLNIRADVDASAPIESVRFDLNGPNNKRTTENLPAYALFGNNGSDYNNGTLNPGPYTLTATAHAEDRATGGAGTPLTISFTVAMGSESQPEPNQPPEANFSATPPRGTAPLLVSFDGGASLDSDGDIVSHQWTFGDGASASGSSVSHTYNAAGSYTATLTVTDDAGDTDSTTQTIQVDTLPERLTLALIDAVNDRSLGTIADGDDFDPAALGLTRFTVEALDLPSNAESVVFELDGPVSKRQTENRTPYVLFGDNRGDYAGGNPEVGGYTLTAEAYSGRNGSGSVVAAETVTFSFTPAQGGTEPPSPGLDGIQWSTLTMANGYPPGPEDIIVVEHGDRLVLDAAMGHGQTQVKGILVYGEFWVEDAGVDLALQADWILLVDHGRLQVGERDQPFASKFTLTLTGEETDQFSLQSVIDADENYLSTGGGISGGMDMNMDPMHNHGHTPEHIEEMMGGRHTSFIMAMGEDAAISIHTDDAGKQSWALLDQTVNVGEDIIVLNKSTGWISGDRIVIASSVRDLNQAEAFTIVDTENDGKTVVLDRPVNFKHYGEIEEHSRNNGGRSWVLDMRAEVGLLSRDVIIQGDVEYDYSKSLADQEDQFGGHTMVMHGAGMYISGLELRYMGQAGELGSYPIHWHMIGDASGQYVEHSSSHHTFNKGMTIHGTQYARIENNIVYENIGQGYFLEDGTEIGNQFIDNLAINTRKPKTQAEATEGIDFSSPSNFWIENAENTFHGNRAAGSESKGFWFDLRGMNGLSNSRQYRDVFEQFASREGPSDFVGNVAHSIPDKAFGLNHAGFVRNYGFVGTDTKPQQVDEYWYVEDFTAYQSGVGIYVRGVGGDFSEVKLADNLTATRLRLNQRISDGLIVGRSGNNRDPNDRAIGGHQLYDGPAGVNNVHFAGFTGPKDAAIKESNAVHKATTHYANKVTFDDAMPISSWVDLGRARTESKALVDLDGSLTGTVGAVVVTDVNGNDRFYMSENSEFRDSWDAIIIRDDTALSSFRINNTSDNTHATVTRSDGEVLGRFAVSSNNEQHLFFSNNEYTYRLKLENAPDEFEIYISDLAYGSSILYQLEGISVDTCFFLDPRRDNTPIMQEASSMEDLTSAPETTVFRTNDSLFIKFVAEMKHCWPFPQPGMTKDNQLMGGVIVNVDSSQSCPSP
ncbi:MAG: PKD domain-containing protein [Candidatus Competibacterales bacterium]